MGEDRWKRITGFTSLRAFLDFEADLKGATLDGEVREVEVDPNYGRAMIYGGQWFENPTSGEVWRLVAPDPPFMGMWEPVLGYGPDSFKDVGRPRSAPLPATPPQTGPPQAAPPQARPSQATRPRSGSQRRGDAESAVPAKRTPDPS